MNQTRIEQFLPIYEALLAEGQHCNPRLRFVAVLLPSLWAQKQLLRPLASLV